MKTGLHDWSIVDMNYDYFVFSRRQVQLYNDVYLSMVMASK